MGAPRPAANAGKIISEDLDEERLDAPVTPGKTFGWLEVRRIGEELAERLPGRDPMRVGFPELRRLVAELPGFKEEPGHPSNERILEEIQRHWIEERADLARDDE